MPQEFQVLQCYNCHTFQVHQVKKTTKWACKMCGEKQSLKKVFGRGSGAECRQHVQKLNTMRGEMDENAQSLRAQSCIASDHVISEQEQINMDNLSRHEVHLEEKQQNQWNKWKAFVEDDLSKSSNLDGDENEDDFRYTTDAVKFKQGHKRKRESKGSNYCRNRSEKWTEFSDATNTGLYGNSSAYNIEHESGLNELPISSGPWQWQSSSSAGIFNQDSSLWRNKMNTYDNEEPSSQESFSNNVYENFAKRIKSETHSTILSKVKGESALMKGNNTLKSTKWSSFTESDLSPKESQIDDFEGVSETSTDSRPYVTFDSSQVKSSVIFKGCHEAENTGDDSRSRERNDLKIAERNNAKFSKWTGFINSVDEWNQSDSEQDFNAGKQNYSKCADPDAVVGAWKQKYSKLASSNVVDKPEGQKNSKWASSNVVDKPGGQKFSKWAEYTEDEKSSKEEQEENCPKLTSVKNSSVLSDNNNSVQRQNPIQPSLSSRHLKSIGNLYHDDNTGKLTNNMKVKPLFTTGDLDDTDLEL